MPTPSTSRNVLCGKPAVYFAVNNHYGRKSARTDAAAAVYRIRSHSGEAGALMPVLHEAQEIYGYLPAEVQTVIAEELNIPLAEVYGVATFYSQF